MGLICKWFGHTWVWGHVWYPWDCWDWWEYKNPHCSRCGAIDYTRESSAKDASNPK